MKLSGTRLPQLSVLMLILIAMAWTSQARQLRPASTRSNRQISNRLSKRRVHHESYDSYHKNEVPLDIEVIPESQYEDELREVVDSSTNIGPSEMRASFVRAVPIL
ncbi:hypothetical protein PCANC_07029 [Puccinia coronata f. sp. avenae]|uniref:Uncharacterized protein n=1 Tax=Puccinia coronata f. sp. avenae TaxID=200324 RepID=A0A2N5SKP3_9BASI|nr:hypothetical protein PCASD_22209 [Puccinia coronata f. sp. avenae]PLW17610.1 hypothetical protein PCANC_15403 [Puccinia coronata f. sp. avenae]PLW41553.1 hypothetical protein PCASD_09982 [Puccinia coronata f. sp. avenae]PLW55411.1 hypothetical protein PCANC_07029 [Puccinia coronata f. sp. avenae]